MGLEISFSDRQLRDICENEDKAINTYGEKLARKLFARLSDLSASETIFDVIAGNPTKMNTTEISITLDMNWELIVTANHTSNPLTNNGEINWARVSRVKIISIEEKSND